MTKPQHSKAARIAKRKRDLEALFKKEVSDRESEVDGSEEQDWYSITLGWAIAKGESPEAAHDFARYIRYDTVLG